MHPRCRHLAGFLPLVLFACDVQDAPAKPADLCLEASEHVASCLGEAITLPATCDSAIAQQVIETPCATLSTSGKADGLSDLLCQLGLLSKCEVPACESPDRFPDFSPVCADYTAAESCGICDYYLCREDEISCGAAGYFESYGFKYCDRFTQVTSARLSAAGQQWFDGTRLCLIDFLESEVTADMECGVIEDAAFDSHPDCYVANGFCELSTTDKLLVIGTIDVADFDLKQALVTSIACLNGMFDPETLEMTPYARAMMAIEAQAR